MQGTEAIDWVDENLTSADLSAFNTSENLSGLDTRNFEVKRVFLGAYFKWNSLENLQIATDHGFISGDEYRKTGHWNFADLDCNFISRKALEDAHKNAKLKSVLIQKKDDIFKIIKKKLIKL